MTELKISSRINRIIAAVIDGVIISIINFIPMAIIIAKQGIMFYYKNVTYGWILWWLFPIFYTVLLHGPLGKGQTIGKRMMGLRVVTVDGKLLTYQKAFLRYGYYMLFPGILNMSFTWAFTTSPPIGLKLLAWVIGTISASYVVINCVFLLTDPGRRPLHDFLAKTVVISHEGEFVSDEAAVFIRNNFEPFRLMRKWGISLAIIIFYFILNSFIYFGLPVSDKVFTSQKSLYNFMVNIPPMNVDLNYDVIMAMEIEEVSEEKRIENIRLLMGELIEQGKIDKKNSCRIFVMPSMEVNIFKMPNYMKEMRDKFKAYVVDHENGTIREDPGIAYSPDGGLSYFFRELDLNILREPWKLHAQMSRKNFAFICYTNRGGESADFYLAVTPNDTDIRYQEIFRSLTKNWLKVVINDAGTEDLYLDNGMKLAVKKVICSHTDSERRNEGYEGVIRLKGRKVFFLWKKYNAPVSTLTKILSDIVDTNQ